MRNIFKSIYSGLTQGLILIFIAVSLKSHSQPLTRSLSTVISDNLDEGLFTVTDRDIYIAGEEVYIKVFCLDRITHKPSDVSKVAYISLLDHSSAPVAQCKLWLERSSGSGEFLIPDTLRTGRYLISACTHWMRNFSPGLFSGKIITVINPFLKIDNFSIAVQQTERDTLSFSTNVSEGKNASLKNTSPPFSKEQLRIETDKTVLSPREKVKVTVSAKDNEGNPAEGDFAISVVKTFTHDSINHDVSLLDIRGDNAAPESRNYILLPGGMIFLPEPEGHIVSGTLYSPATGRPVAGEDIILSFVGKTSLCRFDRTDEKGIFNFIIYESGKQELVIQPLNPYLKDLYVELDNPFPEAFSLYDPGHFFIDTARIKELNNIIISMQVQALYRQYRDSVKKNTETETGHDFYGDPAYSIRISDFIELTSIKEIFKELIPVAFIETRKGQSRFILKNSSPDEYYLREPFVLVDGVPVNDHDAILKIGSAEMEKINVLNCRYYISDVCLDGIVDFKTIKGNFSESGIDMPLFRQEFDAPLAGSDFYSPEYNTAEQKESRIPDYRNTLYWNPDIRTDKNGIATAEFFTSDEPGDYLINVEGITSDGLQVSARTVFSVKAR